MACRCCAADGADQFLQQYMTPTTPDPNQQRMMMLTAADFHDHVDKLSRGMALYYFSSNLLALSAYFLNREFQQYTPAT